MAWQFPDPRGADANGIVGFGYDLRPATLLAAYRKGIFPWPIKGYSLPWFSPDPRGVLEFQDLHVPRSTRQLLKKKTFGLTIDRAFERVIRACADVPRPRQPGTWITPDIVEGYVALHRKGHAHSVEAWTADGELAGGIYGVDSGGAFSAESMFHTRSGASKLALLHLIEHLRSRGLQWLDIEVISPHTRAMGAREIPREEFLERLDQALLNSIKLF